MIGLQSSCFDIPGDWRVKPRGGAYGGERVPGPPGKLWEIEEIECASSRLRNSCRFADGDRKE